ncbi:MAG: DUF6531 domain-containing protein, partial [Gammaproteobacteria bacterium]|nr:DUF6531 domain-containing protein [Gammaproteobacteria bacterium]
MNLRNCLVSILAACVGLLAIVAPPSALAVDCNASLPFSYNGNCYATLGEAESVMRGTKSPTGAELSQDWRIYFELKTPQVGNTYNYHLPPRPHLSGAAWKTHMNRSWASWTWGGFGSPYFETYVQAEEWLDQYAGIPSLDPNSNYFPAFNQLVYRGTSNGTRYYSDVLLDSYPMSVDLSEVWWMSCSDFTPGSINSKAGRATHSLYQPESAGPPPILYRNFVGECDDAGVTYKFWPINVTNIFQISAGLCQTPYVSDGTQCVSGLEEKIVKDGPYSLAKPEQHCVRSNGTNPCDPADGTKVQVEVDYLSPAIGGLEFKRYYRSKGPYKTDSTLGTGWRHTYSRRLDEIPDVNATTAFAAPVDQSSSYFTAADACTSGWAEIRNIVWSGDLSSATATFAGGNTCRIEQNGSPVAYLPVRSAIGFGGYTQAPNIKTVSRPNGAVDTFEFDGTAWVNYLDPTLTLQQVGSDWIYTDANDSKETYNAAGNLIKIETREGLITTIQHGASFYTLNRPIKVTGPFGHYIDFYYVYPTGELDSFAPQSFDRLYFKRSGMRLTGVTQTAALGQRYYLYERNDLPDHLTGIIDKNGDRFATWDYDDSGRAILSEHAGGKEQVVLTYNADDSTTLTMGNGATRTYHYVTEQGERKLAALTGDVCGTCPGGAVKNRSYDSNGFVDEVEDWNGNVTQTVRNSRGLVETLIEAKGTADERTTTTTWHPTLRLPTQLVSPKNTTDLDYDATGNLLSITVTGNAGTRNWTFTYNSSGQPLTIDGPRTDVNDVTTITYHTCTTGAHCGQIKTVTNAFGQVTGYDDPVGSYDGSGRLTRVADPNGLRIYYSYNTRGLLWNVRLYSPSQGTVRDTTLTYDNVGQVKTVTTADGMVLTYTYDAAHYLRSVADNFGNRIDYDYDAMGNIKDEDTYDAGSTLKRAVDYVHDINNRLDAVSDGGFVTDFTLDLIGNLTNETDPKLAHTEHVYDALNRLERTIDSLSGLTDYSYDEHDNVVSVLAPNGAQTTYVYDDLDNLIQEVSPDRGTLTYTYDAAGNRITELDARGKLTTYAYDALNRLTLVTLDGGGTIAYEYDVGTNAIGRLNKIADASGQTTWTYNNFGEVTEKVQTIGAVALSTSYGYDTQGRLTSMTLPSGKVLTFGYNVFHPNSISVTGQTILSGAGYDPFGPVNGWTWGNGSVASRNFDLRGLTATHSLGSDTRTLGYDPAGQVTAMADTGFDVGYGYDLLGRLTGFTNHNGGSAPGPMFSSTPVILADIQTAANETGNPAATNPTPWLTTGVRNVTATSVQFALERSEVNTGAVTVNETIGYVAIQAGASGSFSANGGSVGYNAQTTTDTVRGWTNGCYSTGFTSAFAGTPTVVASMNRHDSGEGGWVRRCSLSSSAVGFTIDEDQFLDSERGHTTEAVGFAAFSQDFDTLISDGVSSWGMEAAKVTLPATTGDPSFKSITFRRTY